ncbi:MAG: hypothetical protein RL059_787 [Bacteroidota bacterium]|jgi:hypothetical protein
MEKTKEIIDYLKFSTKLRVLRYAKDCGKNKNACEVFGVKKSTFTFFYYYCLSKLTTQCN